MVVDDRAYNDYELFTRWKATGVSFFTQMKENYLFEVAGEKEIPKNQNILKDELIEFRGVKAKKKCSFPLRRIEVFDPNKGKIFVFLKNHFRLGDKAISAIYSEGVGSAVGGKALKQNPKIKTFVRTSANAIKRQI